MAGLAAASRIVVWAGLLVLAPALLAVDWQVPEATVRYKLDLNRRPTHPSAGYFVNLPDGGLLHGTTPSTTVMTEDGKVLPSYLLWHNSETGFSIVFADPGDLKKPVYVYHTAGRGAKLWAPNSGLTPSTLLCTNPGRDSIKLAQDLAKLGPVDPDAHVENKAGIARAPLSIGGDDSGRPRPASLYMLAYLEAFEAGKYWISPTVHEGLNELQIDGARVSPKAHSKAWGGTGAMVDLTKGLHRVEIYQTEVPTGPPIPPQGLMFLTWRPPKEQFKEVESRIVKDSEIVRSGACNLAAVEGKDKTPVAAANATASLVYWFEAEEPLLLYDLRAIAAGQPPGTTYTWTFPDGGTLDGEKVQWIFPGLRQMKVKLTAKNGAATSQAIIPFFSFGTAQTSLDKPQHRAAFRNAVSAMLTAYPKAPDPVANWSDAWWNNISRTIEGGEGDDLLKKLFTDHFDVAKKKLPQDKLYTLEDILLDTLQRTDAKVALGWLQRFAPGGADANRQNELKLRECEIQIYYLNDRKTALATLTTMSGQLNKFGELAKVRLGDLAFLEGDLNKATSFYADVQNRARTARNLAAPPQLGLFGVKPTPAPGDKPAGPPKTLGALQEVSLSENVQTLSEKGFLTEAHQALQLWETEFPLSKITGDYILRESELAMKTQDWKRAQPMLETYCREIDASSFLPDAVSLLMNCVKGAKEPPASIKDILDKVKARLKFHPIASEIEKFQAGK